MIPWIIRRSSSVPQVEEDTLPIHPDVETRAMKHGPDPIPPNPLHLPEKSMKLFLIIAWAALLCSCSAAPVLHSSINGHSYSSGPTRADDPRLGRRQFYSDESDAIPWLRGAPRTYR